MCSWGALWRHPLAPSTLEALARSVFQPVRFEIRPISLSENSYMAYRMHFITLLSLFDLQSHGHDYAICGNTVALGWYMCTQSCMLCSGGNIVWAHLFASIASTGYLLVSVSNHDIPILRVICGQPLNKMAIHTYTFMVTYCLYLVMTQKRCCWNSGKVETSYDCGRVLWRVPSSAWTHGAPGMLKQWAAVSSHRSLITDAPHWYDCNTQTYVLSQCFCWLFPFCPYYF